MLRFGLFGAGRIGRVHAASVAMHRRAELAVVYDPVEAAAREVAGQYGAAPTGDAGTILGDPDIGAVIIASPTPVHVDLLTASAQAGKAVLCEKPIDLDLARVDACWADIKGLAATPNTVRQIDGGNMRFLTSRERLFARDHPRPGQAWGRVAEPHGAKSSPSASNAAREIRSDPQRLLDHARIYQIGKLRRVTICKGAVRFTGDSVRNFVTEFGGRFSEPGQEATGKTAECYQLKCRPVIKLLNLHAHLGNHRRSDVARFEFAWMQIQRNSFCQHLADSLAAQAQHDPSVRLVRDRCQGH